MARDITILRYRQHRVEVIQRTFHFLVFSHGFVCTITVGCFIYYLLWSNFYFQLHENAKGWVIRTHKKVHVESLVSRWEFWVFLRGAVFIKYFRSVCHYESLHVFRNLGFWKVLNLSLKFSFLDLNVLQGLRVRAKIKCNFSLVT